MPFLSLPSPCHSLPSPYFPSPFSLLPLYLSQLLPLLRNLSHPQVWGGCCCSVSRLCKWPWSSGLYFVTTRLAPKAASCRWMLLVLHGCLTKSLQTQTFRTTKRLLFSLMVLWVDWAHLEHSHLRSCLDVVRWLLESCEAWPAPDGKMLLPRCGGNAGGWLWAHLGPSRSISRCPIWVAWVSLSMAAGFLERVPQEWVFQEARGGASGPLMVWTQKFQNFWCILVIKVVTEQHTGRKNGFHPLMGYHKSTLPWITEDEGCGHDRLWKRHLSQWRSLSELCLPSNKHCAWHTGSVNCPLSRIISWLKAWPLNPDLPGLLFLAVLFS